MPVSNKWKIERDVKKKIFWDTFNLYIMIQRLESDSSYMKHKVRLKIEQVIYWNNLKKDDSLSMGYLEKEKKKIFL